MKAYVVIELAIIEYEECFNVMGVFSSIEKAEEAIARYEEHYRDAPWHHEFYYEDYAIDEIWDKLGFKPDIEDSETEE